MNVEKSAKPASKFDQEAKFNEEKYLCRYCGKPTWSNTVAIWCSDGDLEGGKCEFKLLSG